LCGAPGERTEHDDVSRWFDLLGASVAARITRPAPPSLLAVTVVVRRHPL
jgi:hypothetical protein